MKKVCEAHFTFSVICNLARLKIWTFWTKRSPCNVCQCSLLERSAHKWCFRRSLRSPCSCSPAWCSSAEEGLYLWIMVTPNHSCCRISEAMPFAMVTVKGEADQHKEPMHDRYKDHLDRQLTSGGVATTRVISNLHFVTLCHSMVHSSGWFHTFPMPHSSSQLFISK